MHADRGQPSARIRPDQVGQLGDPSIDNADPAEISHLGRPLAADQEHDVVALPIGSLGVGEVEEQRVRVYPFLDLFETGRRQFQLCAA